MKTLETTSEKRYPTLNDEPQKGVQAQLSLSDRISLISLMDGGMHPIKTVDPALGADLFDNLWELVNSTVSGSRIHRLEPEESLHGFRVLEVKSDSGEILGSLNMLFLEQPIPCYYLVYVEVAPFFRKKGLGKGILEHFRDFLVEEDAIGLLDNIIPIEDPSYSIYFKLGWEPIERVIGDDLTDDNDNYMIYIPSSVKNRDLKVSITGLLRHLKQMRPAIDKKDNELMVQKSIEGFKGLYKSLLTYFDSDIGNNKATPFMQFMFTRFALQWIAFWRRIEEMIGYTGGQAMDQISLEPDILALSAQIFPPEGLDSQEFDIAGDRQLCLKILELSKNQPATFIESLPNYSGRGLGSRSKQKDIIHIHDLEIGELMDMGFDPTRFKEVVIDNKEYIFERVKIDQITVIKEKQQLLKPLSTLMANTSAKGATIRFNPPLVIIRNRGNAYVMHHKVGGIPWDEAMKEIKTNTHLKNLNHSINLEKLIRETVQAAARLLINRTGVDKKTAFENLSWLLSWNIKNNHPGLLVDYSGSSFETLWIA